MYLQEPGSDVRKHPLTDRTVSFWPAWIYNQVAGKLSISELDNFTKLRQYLSIRDIVQMNIVNQLIQTFIADKNTLRWRYDDADNKNLVEKIRSLYFYPTFRTTKNNDWSNNGFSHFSAPDLSEVTKIEYYATFDLLVADIAFLEQIFYQIGFLKMEESEEGLCCEDARYKKQTAHQEQKKLPYKTIRHTDGVIVVLEEEAMLEISTKQEILEFLRNILKEMYAVDSFESVNTSDIYEAYVAHL